MNVLLQLCLEWLTNLGNLTVAEWRIADSWKYTVLIQVCKGKDSQ